MPTIPFSELATLLRKSADDPKVVNALVVNKKELLRDEHFGFFVWKKDGLDVVFIEAPWVLPKEKIKNPKDLVVCSFHCHRAGHEGFKGYSPELPAKLQFGDSREKVLQIYGKPARSGGGEFDEGLGEDIPAWIAYDIKGNSLHFQFDERATLEMVTIEAPDVI